MTNNQKDRKAHQVTVWLTDEQLDYIIKREIPVSTYLRSLLADQMADTNETNQLLTGFRHEIQQLRQLVATIPPPVPSIPTTLTIKRRTIEEREVSIEGEQHATPEMLIELKEKLKKRKVESWAPISVEEEGD